MTNNNNTTILKSLDYAIHVLPITIVRNGEHDIQETLISKIRYNDEMYGKRLNWLVQAYAHNGNSHGTIELEIKYLNKIRNASRPPLTIQSDNYGTMAKHDKQH